jgi:hypothetical protein
MCTPALKVCPECGAEVDQVHKIEARGKTARLYIPAKFCPVCRAPLDLPTHTAAETQAQLPGVG